MSMTITGVHVVVFLTIFAWSADSAEVSVQGVSYSQNYEDSLESELKVAQLQQDDDEPDDDEIAEEQILSFFAKHVGKAACKYLRRKPRVLEQDIHTWLQSEVAAIEKYDEQKAVMQFRFFKRAFKKARRIYKRVRHRVRRTVRRVRSRVRKVGRRFGRWYGRVRNGIRRVKKVSRKWFKGIRRKAGRWYRILKSKAGRFGGMVKKFVRRAGKIGRTVCNLVYGKCKKTQE